tara:strand:+ start:1299 stop:2204 length:906 start_codon:yes stop_codon:yes gene_type:complete
MRFVGNIKIKSKNYILAIILLAFHSSLYAHPFLWKVTGEHEFYLFGTIHLPDPRVTELPEEVTQALKESTSFYAELDLSESNTMMIKQSMWLPDKKTLHDHLPAQLQSQIETYLKQVHPELNLEFFIKQKIWVLAITLTVIEQQLKYPGQLALDAALFEQAAGMKLSTGGLESVEEQLSVFDIMTEKQQLTFLSDTLEYLQTSKDQNYDFIEESIEAYLHGDLDLLMTYLMSYMKDNELYSQLLDRLIDQRNYKMVETIHHLVNENSSQSYFFAIGAGHFWGHNGINTLLQEKGYTLEQID